MKKTRLSILAILIIMSGISCSLFNKSIEKKQDTVKILSYNVRNCLGMDGITDYHRVANIITRLTPDVVALQELDSATQRSKGVVVLDTLASSTKMYKTYGASIAYQGGKYGIGVLSRERPLNSKVVALPGREERRSLLIVELKDFFICCTHFSLTEEDRVASVEIIQKTFKEFSKPIFMAGDFNAVPGSDEIKKLEESWLMLNNPANPTIPSPNPKKCIDYVFASKLTGSNFLVKQTVVENEPVASDHLPVWVEVELN